MEALLRKCALRPIFFKHIRTAEETSDGKHKGKLLEELVFGINLERRKFSSGYLLVKRVGKT